ncbi:MAG: NAD(+) synthase [Bacteroidetes bacterium]|nr:NAD(+) synthase [Bacteroidota bacterium]
MNKAKEVALHIVDWLRNYAESAKVNGYIIGISGGIDSALTSTLCALTGKKVIVLSMPIRQGDLEYTRAKNHIDHLLSKFENVQALTIDLTPSFEQIEKDLPVSTSGHFLSMANTRSRLRMLTLYAVGQSNGLLVAGTGNKVEDFGIGFYTKYGDGGVDVSPIADLMKTEVWELAAEVGVLKDIIEAKPTDGLFDDGRSDEDQIGASYPELEWAMEYQGDSTGLSPRQKEVLDIYKKLNTSNKHKMNPIPVCIIPKNLR